MKNNEQAKALTDEQIIDLADDFKSTYRHGGIDFPEFDYIGFAHALLDSQPSKTPYAYVVRGLILNENPFLVFEKEIADGFSEASGRREGTKAYEVFPVYRNALSAQADVAAVRDAAPKAYTDLLAYVLQDDIQNRLTPRVIDIAYTAFMCAKNPNEEDGGASDWFTDTRPVVMKAIEKLRKDLEADALKSAAPAAQPQDKK